MAVCIMNPVDTNGKKVTKFSLKLLGIGRYDLSEEEILECVAKSVEPMHIEGLLFDSFNNYYVLFLKNIETTCQLVGKKLKAKSFTISMCPLLDCYLVDNVYPCVRNEELCEIFRLFGHVFTISNHHLVPNSTKFSHVLSGKREITFLLPGDETEIYIPVNVVHPPYSFNVKKLCCACYTEGHSLLYCPDIPDVDDKKEIECVEEDSDCELDAIIKSEDFLEDSKIEDSTPEPQVLSPLSKTSHPRELKHCPSVVKRHYSYRSVGNSAAAETTKQIEQPEIASEKKIVQAGEEIMQEDVNSMQESENDVQDEATKDMPGEEKHQKSGSNVASNLTEVVSTSKVCRFNFGPIPIEAPSRQRNFVKRGVLLLPPLAEELINEVCASHVLETNVFKHLVLLDGRLKAEIIKFSFKYLDDLSTLLKLLKRVFKRCYTDKKYAVLRGPFTSKVKRIHSILYDLCKKK